MAAKKGNGGTRKPGFPSEELSSRADPVRLFPLSELSPLFSGKFGVSEFFAKTKVPRRTFTSATCSFWLEQLAGPMTRALPTYQPGEYVPRL